MRRRGTAAQQARLLQMLKDARTDKGVTQVELAERLGVPQSFVSKYESGERRLDILELREICHALRVNFIRYVTRMDKLLK